MKSNLNGRSLKMRPAFILIFIFLILTLLHAQKAFAQIDSIEIDSKYLSRHITTYIYDPAPNQDEKPIIYFTDGLKFIQNGALDSIANLFHKGFAAATCIFTCSIDIHTGIDYRNEYFFGNLAYLNFFEKELIPTVENGKTTEQRSLVGISFGGLNAAYFSAHSNQFASFALLSPITYPRPSVHQEIVHSDNKDLKIYLSSGLNDAEHYLLNLEKIYRSKSYTITSIQTKGAHDFQNWNAQLPQVFRFLTEH